MIKACVYFSIMALIGVLTFFSIGESDFGFISSFLMAPVPLGVMLFGMMIPIVTHNMEKSLAWPPPSYDEDGEF